MPLRTAFCTTLLLLLMPWLCLAEVVDKIIAVVNDDIITLKDVERYVRVESHERYVSVKDYFRNLQIREKLDPLIEDLLIKQQAKKLKIEISDKELEHIVENIKKQYLITEEQLREQLRSENVDYKDFLEGLKSATLRTRVLARAISMDINVTDDMLKEYYNKHLNEFSEEEYRLKQIFISGSTKKSEEKALKAYELLKAGRPFEEVAKEFSEDPSATEGGDIGMVKKEELIPQLKQAIEGLAPGSFSGIVATPYGFHIIKLVDSKRIGTLPFDAVKEEIQQRIIQEEAEKRYRAYIEDLKRSSYIEVKV